MSGITSVALWPPVAICDPPICTMRQTGDFVHRLALVMDRAPLHVTETDGRHLEDDHPPAPTKVCVRPVFEGETGPLSRSRGSQLSRN
jgi:hypothetical protein